MLKFSLLILVGLLWGSQYIFVKLALVDLDPWTLTFCRLGLGTLFLAIICLIFRAAPESEDQRMSRSPWWLIAIIGVLEAGVPALLIAWGQQWVDSSLAAILLGTTPLFTIVLSCFILAHERIRPGLLISIAGGFIGLLLLFGLRIQLDAPLDPVAGAAILIAAICFATSLVLVARVKGHATHVFARDLMFWSALFMLPIWLIQGQELNSTPGWPALISILYLATLGSGTVFIIYVRLVRIAGPTFASLSNYLVPVVGVVLGIWLGQEEIKGSDFIALLIILASLAAARPGIFQRRTDSST
ncbi:MAG: hypothetical protein CMJ39_01705 [Phycisphaerae bacterium]|nr:hypothetical protein [Phycisphaerae bacterium]|tara:strand:- start:112 stop:1014 length:903 start_codon:yes stop_codon:yes gene_type:complete